MKYKCTKRVFPIHVFMTMYLTKLQSLNLTHLNLCKVIENCICRGYYVFATMFDFLRQIYCAKQYRQPVSTTSRLSIITLHKFRCVRFKLCSFVKYIVIKTWMGNTLFGSDLCMQNCIHIQDHYSANRISFHIILVLYVQYLFSTN
jgi:hypothetical protein